MICNNISQNNCESFSKKYKTNSIDKKVTPYVDVQLSAISCLFFLKISLSIPNVYDLSTFTKKGENNTHLCNILLDSHARNLFLNHTKTFDFLSKLRSVCCKVNLKEDDLSNIFCNILCLIILGCNLTLVN